MVAAFHLIEDMSRYLFWRHVELATLVNGWYLTSTVVTDTGT
jgi:hypothetical protein